MANLPMPEGLTNSDLECVMLDLPAIDVAEAFGDDYDPNDLFFSDHPDLTYVQGDVAAGSAHVTLLFGIHPSDTYEEDVMSALADREISEVLLRNVSFFDSRVEGQDYYCVIGHIVPSRNLLVANRRLQALPHTNQYTEYKPHVTLAYIEKTADLEVWLERLNARFAGTVWPVIGLNLGKD